MDQFHRESSGYYNDDHADYKHSGLHHPYHTDNGMNYHLKGHDSHHSDIGDYTMHGGPYDGRYGSVGGVPRSEHLDGDMDMRLGNSMMDKQRNNSISSNASSNSSSSTANKHPCKFPTCGWSFKRYEHLKRHMLVHTKERPFVCEFQGCEKSFSRSDNFSAHLRTHTKKTMHMRKFDRHLMMDSNNNFMPLNTSTVVGSGGMVASGMVCVGGGNDDGRGYSNESSHYRHGMNGYLDYQDTRHSPPSSHAQAIGAGHGPLDSVPVNHGANPISKSNNRPPSRNNTYSLPANSCQGADYEGFEDRSPTSPPQRFSLSKYKRSSSSLGTHSLDGPIISTEYKIDTIKREESSSSLSTLSTMNNNNSTFSLNLTTSATSVSPKTTTTLSGHQQRQEQKKQKQKQQQHHLSKADAVLPKFSPIKLDLKAVSNNPDDVHLHNQHNVKSESLHCNNHHPYLEDDHHYYHRPHQARPDPHHSRDHDRYREFDCHTSSSRGGPPPYARFTSPGLRSPSPPYSSFGFGHRRYGSADMSRQHPPHHRVVMLGSSHDNPNPNPNGESPTLPPRRLPSPHFGGGEVSTGFSSHFVPMELGLLENRQDRDENGGGKDEENDKGDERVRGNGDDDNDDDDDDDDNEEEENEDAAAENALRAKKLKMGSSYRSSFKLSSHSRHRQQQQQQQHHSQRHAHQHLSGSVSPPPMVPIRSSSEEYVGSAVMLDEDGNPIQGYGDGTYHRHSIAGYSPDRPSSIGSGQRMPIMSPRLQSSSSSSQVPPGSSGSFFDYSDGHRGTSYPSSSSYPQHSSQGYPYYGEPAGGGMTSPQLMSIHAPASSSSVSVQQLPSQNYQHQKQHQLTMPGGMGGGATATAAVSATTTMTTTPTAATVATTAIATGGRVRGSGGPSKNHCCPVPGCMKRFKRLEHLKRHTKTHTLERPFACTNSGCNKRFSRSDNLSQHIKTHQRHLIKAHWKHRSTIIC
ncbi:hypothetical protein BGX29_007454 [Mortierella sp. GBA35]|nr:hypothetical protein BGX29_007454 [Mortierella sp. GBA35]